MPNQKTQKNYGDTLLSWEALEFPDVHRGPTWMAIAGATMLLFILFAIWQDNYIFAVLVLMISGIYFLIRNQKPRQITINITTLGVVADNNFYPYTEMQAFWIVYRPDINVKALNITSRSGWNRHVVLQLEDQDPNEVRLFLGSHVYEWKAQGETTLDRIIRLLKL